MAYPPPPYADAVCGTFVCGEAICGAWWAYPPAAGQGFGATIPDAVTIISGDIVPSARLALGATAPGLVLTPGPYFPPSAGLGFGATPPLGIRISSIIAVPSAGLAFGATPPETVGASWLTEAECIDMTLVEDAEGSLVLVAAGSTDLVLDPEECL
jgi:hypothetical protein